MGGANPSDRRRKRPRREAGLRYSAGRAPRGCGRFLPSMVRCGPASRPTAQGARTRTRDSAGQQDGCPEAPSPADTATLWPPVRSHRGTSSTLRLRGSRPAVADYRTRAKRVFDSPHRFVDKREPRRTIGRERSECSIARTRHSCQPRIMIPITDPPGRPAYAKQTVKAMVESHRARLRSAAVTAIASYIVSAPFHANCSQSTYANATCVPNNAIKNIVLILFIFSSIGPACGAVARTRSSLSC